MSAPNVRVGSDGQGRPAATSGMWSVGRALPLPPVWRPSTKNPPRVVSSRTSSGEWLHTTAST